jgi:tRNA-splicing ligase RtcB
LDVERPGQGAISDFYEGLRTRYPYPPTMRRDLTSREVLRCAAEGSTFATERFDVDPAELDRVEERGRIDLESLGGSGRVRKELPRLIVQLSRTRFGTIGPSNHFVELQEVEEIFDPMAAHLLGISAGQVTLQYHAGGGVLTGLIGRLYGRRTDFPRRHRAIMAVQKPLLHLAGARSLAELRLRRFLYFSGECPPIPRDSAEGMRLMLANAAAMNYGFAFRLAVYQALRSMALEALGVRSSKLVVDSPHDTMYEEDLDGQKVLLHRYKSCRAYPPSRMAGHPVFGRVGQPVLIPGLHSTSSYLCVADEGASESLYSACHGTGSVISDFARRGISGPDPRGRSTLRFGYSDAAPADVPHLDDRGIDEAVGILVRHRIVRPVARLRPFAVLT